MTLGERGPARYCAGNGDGARPALLDGVERLRTCRHWTRRVERLHVAVVPDDREGVAADARRHRLGDAEHRRRGHGRICRVSAALEHA
jgi:hypothetical protein